ncbi:MAG: glycoside hydrolase family 2 TIM barrel-domain containing protein [archaeon]
MRKNLESLIAKCVLGVGLFSIVLLNGCSTLSIRKYIETKPSYVEVKKIKDDWNLFVNKKRYIVKGMVYEPTPPGYSPQIVRFDWMNEDSDKNGKANAPYESFIDANKNNVQDVNEPRKGDFSIMKEMGVNTIRIYHIRDFSEEESKKTLNDLYKKYGVMVLVGDYLGAYTKGSGASWQEGTDYTNPDHKKKMLEEVISIVKSYKNEPFVLGWVLGNENTHMGTRTNAAIYPKEYYSFVNDVAKVIHKNDKKHPVILCNTSTHFVGAMAKYIPDIDIFGANAFDLDKAGNQLFSAVKKNIGKPVIITEYGTSSYNNGKLEEDESIQAEIHSRCWKTISSNFAGSGNRNSLGGVIFEWTDEWWKTTDPLEHDAFDIELIKQGSPNISEEELKKRMKNFINPNEEYLGICSLGNGKNNFLRQLKKVYYLYKSELWNN